MQGIKTTSDLTGIYKHNVERVSHTNKDIDKSRSNNNITLIECKNYNKKFNEIVAPMKAEHEERMKTMRADRVKTFNQHINSSKNDVAFESVFTSDKEFFKNMSSDDIKRWAEKSLDFITKDLGIERKNILHAVVHMDEETPHLHVVSVPLVRKFNKKQNKEVWSISRRHFVNGKAQYSEMQDIYNKRMNESGYKLDRGESGTSKDHTTKAEYTKNQLKALEDKLNTLESDYKAVEGVEKCLADIDKVQAKKSRITGNTTLKTKDYEMLVALARQGVHNASKIKDLEVKNEKLEQSISYTGSKNTSLWNENFNLKHQNSILKSVIDKHNLRSEVRKELEAPVKNLSKSFEMER